MKKSNTIWIVIGTRPNFIKVTQFKRVAAGFPHIDVKIVHTGQHYDERMASVFFDQFGLRPDVFLDINPGHPGVQIGEAISALVQLFLREKPDLVMVVGDVNSTLAGAVAANKCNIPLAHLESGLRSNDLEMPEEHNRRVADLLSNLHFVTEDSGMRNLRAEGAPESGLAFVGNTMIDTLVAFRDAISKSSVLNSLNLDSESFALVTIHRPSNVDSQAGLRLILDLITEMATAVKVVFPVHPRTRDRMAAFGLLTSFEKVPNLIMIDPLGYFDFQNLIANSSYVLTDSGGIQEETTFLKKPCLTLRPNTERPSTIEIGSNTLLEFDIPSIMEKIRSIYNQSYKKGQIPLLWDGNATLRIMERIETFFESGQ